MDINKLKSTIAGDIVTSKDVGNSIKKWREIFGISQSELAEHIGITSSTLSDYESGRRKNPGVYVISRFVDALINIDLSRGAKVIKQLIYESVDLDEFFELHEFSIGVRGNEFAKLLNARVVVNEDLLDSKIIYGYSLINSLKTIVELPSSKYLFIYGKTPMRALIFKGVKSGRSPMIAIKISSFAVDLKPSLVVFIGIEEIDFVAEKIAEKEKIPLLLTEMSEEEIRKALKVFE